MFLRRWQGECDACGRPSDLKYQDSFYSVDFAADVDGGTGFESDVVRKYLEVEGDLSGYLFQCLTCGAHRLHVDSC
ncbi:hypothetical protein CH292_19445 [Rhodococcus sp. 14-2470-1a]|nr:hypothetical protein CH292_19445 [Rhodococcus sp. 14-2470-1a]